MTDPHREWAERQLAAKRGRLAGHALEAWGCCSCGEEFIESKLSRARAVHRSHKVDILAEQARRGEVGM